MGWNSMHNRPFTTHIRSVGHGAVVARPQLSSGPGQLLGAGTGMSTIFSCLPCQLSSCDACLCRPRLACACRRSFVLMPRRPESVHARAKFRRGRVCGYCTRTMDVRCAGSGGAEVPGLHFHGRRCTQQAAEATQVKLLTRIDLY